MRGSSSHKYQRNHSPTSILTSTPHSSPRRRVHLRGDYQKTTKKAQNSRTLKKMPPETENTSGRLTLRIMHEYLMRTKAGVWEMLVLLSPLPKT